MINRNGHLPLYIQLSDILREKIRSGEIQEGDKLPSETEMIEEYHLGRLTIREALGILVNEGLLEKHHGKGTFCKTNFVSKKQRVDIFLDLADVEFIPYYLRSICAVLEAENVDIIMGDTRNSAEVICNLIENALISGTDGIIFQPSNTEENAPEKLCEILKRVTDAKIPYVMIDTFYKNLPESYVVMDEHQAGKIAADYFVRMGHAELCAIGHPQRVDSTQRINGFAESLEIKPYFIEADGDIKGQLKDIFSKNSNITGVFCFNDWVAKKCYDALSSLNISIPRQVSVIGVDDTIVATTLSPTLTSVIHPKENLGKEAARAIVAMISGEEVWPYKKVFQPSLAIRKSCQEI